jgi:membrane fusion protein (multidrug efflux system)
VGCCILATLFIAACGEKPVEKKGAPPTLITTTLVRQTSLEISERTLGTLTAVKDPMISAEVPGKIIKIAVRTGEPVKKGQLLARIDPSDVELQASADRADVARIETLLAQQERVVARQNELVEKNFISRNALDDATAQRDALKNQLASARAAAACRATISTRQWSSRLSMALSCNRWRPPVTTCQAGDPMFRFVSNERLRAYLPFPSLPHRASRSACRYASQPAGTRQPNRCSGRRYSPDIRRRQPRHRVIARLENPGMLKGGGSVDATVITGRKDNARWSCRNNLSFCVPAGKVVYVIAEGKAKQQVVKSAASSRALIEITSGLQW